MSLASLPGRRPLQLPDRHPPVLLVVIDTEEEFDWDAPRPFSRENTSVEAMRGEASSRFPMGVDTTISGMSYSTSKASSIQVISPGSTSATMNAISSAGTLGNVPGEVRMNLVIVNRNITQREVDDDA